MYRQNKKFVVLLYSPLILGGDFIDFITNLFFISFIINAFIVFYSAYVIVDIIFFKKICKSRFNISHEQIKGGF